MQRTCRPALQPSIHIHLQEVLQHVNLVCAPRMNINLTKTSAVPTEFKLGKTGGA
jgi:hypothetical protein